MPEGKKGLDFKFRDLIHTRKLSKKGKFQAIDEVVRQVYLTRCPVQIRPSQTNIKATKMLRFGRVDRVIPLENSRLDQIQKLGKLNFDFESAQLERNKKSGYRKITKK